MQIQELERCMLTGYWEGTSELCPFLSLSCNHTNHSVENKQDDFLGVRLFLRNKRSARMHPLSEENRLVMLGEVGRLG